MFSENCLVGIAVEEVIDDPGEVCPFVGDKGIYCLDLISDKFMCNLGDPCIEGGAIFGVFWLWGSAGELQVLLELAIDVIGIADVGGFFKILNS